jgi:PAS domain S-box-containing protein
MDILKAWLARLTVRRKLRLLTLLFVAGYVTLLFMANDTLQETEVNGPYYQQIIRGKDVIADVLPPPEYIIESYLLVLQMVESDDPRQLELFTHKLRQLENQYVERHVFWLKDLPDGELRQALLVDSFGPAQKFFAAVHQELMPTLYNGDRASAEKLAKGVLRDHYEQHRKVIDRIVELATQQVVRDELATRQLIAYRTKLLVGLGVSLALLVTLSSEFLGQQISSRLEQTVQVLGAVAKGDLQQRLPTRGHDEFDHMAIALNQAVAASQSNLHEAREAEQTIRQLNVSLEQRIADRTFELRERQERLRAILDSAADAIISVDGAGLIEAVNPAVEQIFGYKPGELLGRNVRILVPTSLREKHDGHLEHLRAISDSETFGVRREVLGQRKDGSEFPVELSVSNASLPGRPQFTAIVRDISRRKRFERELAQAKEAAEFTSQAKSLFLATMSHELRTPLNGILGMNELLLGTPLSDRQREFVNASRTSGKLLLNLINDILDLSKIEAGKLELDPQDCRLESLVFDVVESLQPIARQKGLALSTHVDPRVCVTAFCDGHRLRQVLVNLVGNAIKFTTSGSVRVSVENIPHEGGFRARFSVTDTGIGIPESRRERLFHPFSQVDSSTTRQFGGTGLGLAIVRQLIELMGGELGLESVVGRGSTFWFELSLPVTPEPTNLSESHSAWAGTRALIVSGDADQTDQIREFLQAWGCGVDSAVNAGDAMQTVHRAESEATPFGFALVEFTSGGTTTFDLIETLSRRWHVPVIAFGSTADDPESRLLLQLGARRWLRTPIRPSTLFDAIAATLLTEADTAPPAVATDDGTSQTLAGHVLVAEDNQINQMFIVELLKHCGCTCDLAATGDDALTAIQRQKYDLVLMDCQMPEMDGFTAAREIRRLELRNVLTTRTPIVALTANALKGDRERCLAAGMDDYLSKPVEAASLQIVLRRFLGQSTSASPHVAPTDDTQPLDLPGLFQRCFNNREFALSLLDEFLASSDSRVDELAAQVGQANLTETKELAHAFKGAASIVGANTLKNFAAQIEASADAGDLIGTLELVSQFRAELHRCQTFAAEPRRTALASP